MGKVQFYRIMVFITAVIIILLTIPYWIYLKKAIDENDVTSTIIYIVSAFILLLIGTVGLIGAGKRHKGCVQFFAMFMITMLIFTIVQLILSIITYNDCGSGNTVPLVTVCSIEQSAYYVPTIIQIVDNILGAVFGILYAKALKNGEDGGGGKGNYY